MSSTKEYLDFILEQLSDLDEISFRAMMGEYIIYYRGKVSRGILKLPPTVRIRRINFAI